MLVFALILLQSNLNTEKGILLHITSKLNKNVTKMNKNALSEINQSDFNLLFESLAQFCHIVTATPVHLCVYNSVLCVSVCLSVCVCFVLLMF